MIHFLRHVSLCLWITLVLAGFGSLYILPSLQPLLGTDAAPVLVAVLLTAVFAAVAWSVSRLGQRRVHRWMHLADRAERGGLCAEAEKAYRNALSVLDSFWASPAARRRILLPLAGRAARFYLSRSDLSAAGEDFVCAYLWAHPQDEEAAEHWLRQAERRGGLRDEHQDLADRLAETHPRHSAIQREAARLYLALERTDHPALQTYRRACAQAGELPPGFCTDLIRLLQREGRTDEWLQPLLRRAGAVAPAPALPLGDGRFEPPQIAGAGARWKQPALSPTFEDDDDVFRISPETDELNADEEEARASLLAEHRRGPSRWDGLVERCSAARQAAVEAFRSFGGSWAHLRQRFLRGWGLRRALALLLIVGIAGGGVWMAANVSEVFTPPPPESSVAEPPAAPAPPPADLFTLQVSAHLKPEYALNMVEDLKRKGLDAYWIASASGGKTWYQVRIAHFPDQQSARDYGRNLKWKGVVDDFYVTRYSR
jgi:hypothetical protein